LATVYSHQFIGESSFSGGPTNFYTTPAGFVAVVKSIAIVTGIQTNPGSASVLETTTGARIGTFGLALTDLPGHDYTTTLLYGQWVIPFSQGLSLETTGTPVNWFADFWVSGYLLTAP